MSATLMLLVASILQPPLPAEALRVKDAAGSVHGRIEIQAETMGKLVRWRLLDAGPLLIEDLPDLRARKMCILYACKPGKYRLECWTAFQDEPSNIVVCTVTVVGEPQPNPGPGPDPLPPPPPPPPPADPLTAALQAAYNQDPQPTAVKAAHLKKLIGLYEAMVEHAQQKSITNLKDLLSDYQATAAGLPNELIGVRKLIAAEVSAVLGTNTNALLDDSTRRKAIELFARLAKAAQAVK